MHPPTDDDAPRRELLATLHREHGPDLRRYVQRLTGDPGLAEDVVQEAMARAWKDSRVLDGDPAGVRPWLFRVARNLVIDDRRTARHRRESAVEVVPDEGVRDDADAVLDRLLITDALASLSAEHREVVVATAYEGRTVADVAARLGVPPGTVKSRLHYGLRALRAALHERGVTR